MLTALVLAALPLGGPCPRCVVWEASAGDVRLLADAPVALDGVALQLEGADSAVVRALEARGATVGTVRATPGLWPADETAPAWVLVRPPEDDRDDTALAFGLKALASDLRARRGDALVGLELAPGRLARLWALDVGPYVD